MFITPYLTWKRLDIFYEGSKVHSVKSKSNNYKNNRLLIENQFIIDPLDEKWIIT